MYSFEILFDTLVKYINRVVVTFENTSQLFYFCTKIFHTRATFERLEQRDELNLPVRYQKQNYHN